VLKKRAGDSVSYARSGWTLPCRIYLLGKNYKVRNLQLLVSSSKMCPSGSSKYTSTAAMVVADDLLVEGRHFLRILRHQFAMNNGSTHDDLLSRDGLSYRLTMLRMLPSSSLNHATLMSPAT